MNDSFLCGVVEGFYGRPWAFEQRRALFERMNSWGMNVFMYAPKDDDKHRADWRDLYTLEEADALRHLIESAQTKKIEFVYALSPGLDIVFSSGDEVKALKRKTDQLTGLGCRSFALLFDDIDDDMSSEDVKTFESFAHAQAHVANIVYDQLDEPSVFLFCPTEYCASRANPSVAKSQYLTTLGTKLNSAIKILWTGPRVISKSITVDSILQLSNVLQRRPVIWDNLHANDYDQRRLFLGPYAGRSADLYPYLDGILTNPNCEFESNFMAINGLALWYQHGKATARDVGGGGGGESPAAELMDVDSPAAADAEKNSVGYDALTSLRAGIQEWLAEFQKPTLASVLRRKTVSAAATTQLEKEGGGGDDSATAAPTFDSEDSAAKRQRRPDGGGGTTTTSSREKLSEEDVAWIVDLFYLPHEHGPRAEELMREFHWLKSHANDASQAAAETETETETTTSDEGSEEFAQQVVSQSEHWLERAQAFRRNCKRVSDLFARLTEIPNRSLLYDLYPYVWDVKEVVMLLDAYVAWLEDGCQKKEGRSMGYLPEDMEPWLFRGGIAAEMQRLLPRLEGSSGEFSNKAPFEPSPRTFIIRPYRPEDEDLVYKTCLVTGDSGNDASENFSDYPSLLGDRYVGPYLHLSPNFAFVLEDDEGVCGYVLGALDSKTFYADYKAKWLPKTLKKYSACEKESASKCQSPAEKLLFSMRTEKLFLPDELYERHPSHLHIDIMPRSQGLGVGKRMIHCLLSALKTKGSRGVFLEMASSNDRAYKFYKKLGFNELKTRDQLPPPGTTIMARAL